MAVYRPPEYCPHCGKQLKSIHQNRGSNFVGDTFVGYKECDCRKELPNAQASVASKVDSSTSDDQQNNPIAFAKRKDDNYIKRVKGFVEKEADLETAVYYSYEDLYKEFKKPEQRIIEGL